MSNPYGLRTALFLAGALAVAGCAGDAGGGSTGSEPLPFAWPPTAGEAYPDLELRNHRGEPVQLSSFQGKVLLIEPIGMT